MGSPFLFDSLLTDPADIIVALVCDDRFRIVVKFFFTVSNMLFDLGSGAVRQMQLFQDFFIPFEHLDGIPAKISPVFDDILDGLLDMRKGVLRAALKHMRPFPFRAGLCSLDDCLCDRADSVRLQGAHFQNSAAKLFFQLPAVNHIPVLADDIHHIDGDHSGNAEFQKLCGQIQVTLYIAAVHNVQDRIRFFIDQILTGDNLFQRIGGQGVNARKILDNDILTALQRAFFLLYRNPGPVADVLI